MGSYGGYINNILRNLITFFHSGWKKTPQTSPPCTNLHSQNQCVKVLFPLHPHQYLLCLFFLIRAILTDVRWYLIVVLVSFSWWLVMLNIFSCVSWPSVCLLWKMLIWTLWSFFKWILLTYLFANWVVRVHVFWILTLIRCIVCMHFLPFCTLSLHFVAFFCSVEVL